MGILMMLIPGENIGEFLGITEKVVELLGVKSDKTNKVKLFKDLRNVRLQAEVFCIEGIHGRTRNEEPFCCCTITKDPQIERVSFTPLELKDL